LGARASGGGPGAADGRMRELKKAMGGKLDAVASPRPGRRGREPTDPENTRVVALRSDSPPPTLPPGRLGPLAGGWGPGQAKKQLLQRSSAVQRLRSVRAALMLKCRVEEIALPTVPVPARRKAAPGGPDPPPPDRGSQTPGSFALSPVSVFGSILLHGFRTSISNPLTQTHATNCDIFHRLRCHNVSTHPTKMVPVSIS